jgi:hypothetical protein
MWGREVRREGGGEREKQGERGRRFKSIQLSTFNF